METCISLVFLHNLYHFISFERIFVMWYNNFLCWIKYFIIIQLILLFLWISQEYIIVLLKIIILWDTICANKQLPIPNVHIYFLNPSSRYIWNRWTCSTGRRGWRCAPLRRLLQGRTFRWRDSIWFEYRRSNVPLLRQTH